MADDRGGRLPAVLVVPWRYRVEDQAENLGHVEVGEPLAVLMDVVERAARMEL